jgi:cytochrome c oxidase cbb3-type subunit 4
LAVSRGLVYGIETAVLLLAFIGIVVWAWSARRQKQFDAAARQPLEEDTDDKADKP